MYPHFLPFRTEEFEKYLYLFFWNGLAPSPQISMKLESEEKNPIHSSHFLRMELGPNASRRLKEWKCCFFSCRIRSFRFHREKLIRTLKWMSTSVTSSSSFVTHGCLGATSRGRADHGVQGTASRQTENHIQEGRGWIPGGLHLQ